MRSNDFCWTSDGELLYFGFECDGGSVDDSCGCKRSFSGMVSHKATTTAEVVEHTITKEGFIAAYMDTMAGAGWMKLGLDHPEVGNAVKMFTKAAEEVLEVAGRFNVGDIVVKRGEHILRRQP